MMGEVIRLQASVKLSDCIIKFQVNFASVGGALVYFCHEGLYLSLPLVQLSSFHHKQQSGKREGFL